MRGDDGRARREHDQRQECPAGREQVERILDRGRVVNDQRALTEIAEHQRGQHEEQPRAPNRDRAEMAHVGVKRLGTRDRQHDCAQREECGERVAGQESERVRRIERRQDRWVVCDLHRSEQRQHREPHPSPRAGQHADPGPALPATRQRTDEDAEPAGNDNWPGRRREPVTLAVPVGLRSMQRHGTASVGVLFGPVVCVWFAVLALLGAMQIAHDPAVLAALNPAYAFGFLTGNPLAAFLALGAVVLAVTGTEALYADMGHFGAIPIRRAWLFFVLPALVLNYFGQGALIIHDPAAIKNPFYLPAPGCALLPLVVVATCPTVRPSHAVISGAFSLTRQAIQMGYCPRLTITHTSDRQIGQIYIPFINWTLLGAVMLLVVGFQSSSNLAA